MIYTIKNDRVAVQISSRGAEIVSIKRGEKEYIWDGEQFWFKHAPLLFPVCGSITAPYLYKGKEYSLTKHGFISMTEFSPVKTNDDEIVLVASSSEETLAKYPFEFEFQARYLLDGDALISEYKIKNRSGEIMPYMFGLHPAFVLHGDRPKEEFYLDFGKEFTATQYRLSSAFINQNGFDRLIPDGKLNITSEIYTNDTIILEGTKKKIDFVSPDGKVFKMQWSDNFKYLCVWKWPDDAARYICIEPWNRLPSDGSKADDFEVKNAVRLAPGAEDTYSCRIDFC